MSRVLQVLFPGRAHCFISCQLLVKDEHRVLVKVFVLSLPRKRVISHSDITSAVWMDVKQEINLKAFIFTLPQSFLLMPYLKPQKT